MTMHGRPEFKAPINYMVYGWSIYTISVLVRREFVFVTQKFNPNVTKNFNCQAMMKTP